MSNIATKYLGLELKNPIIAGASNLSASVENLKKMEAAGASAIVFKSLFEEQIQYENLQAVEIVSEFEERHAEMTSIFPDIKDAEPYEHLQKLKKAKEVLDIPVIASLNAVYLDTWTKYAQELANTGADALELNFYHTPMENDPDGNEMVARQINIAKQVKAVVDIPVSVKLSPYYTNLFDVVKRIDFAGIDGLVLFNRLFQPRINVETESHEFPWNLSNSGDSGLALRFAGLLYGNIEGDMCASNGIHDAAHVIEMLLAGASAVQVVSAVYKNGIDYLGQMLKDVQKWLDEKGYEKIDDFRGKLSKKNVSDPFVYQRAQYVDILWNSDNVYKQFRQV